MSRSFSSFIAIASVSIASLFFQACSCGKPSLSGRLYPQNRKDLASYQVDTPDPLKVTQQPEECLVIDWNYASQPTKKHSQRWISIFLRFRDGSEIEKSIPVATRFGRKTIRIPESQGDKKGRIASYKIQLLQDGTCIAESRHKLWEDTLQIPE